MQDLEQRLNDIYTKNLAQKRTWYSPVADIYHKARPRYPQEIINPAVILAQISSNTRILEVVSGPGNATVAFAQFGASMTCLEPNQEFYHLAERNCASYPKVKICHTSLEEWKLETNQFNAVLSANAFHWIAPEIGYLKAAEALQDKGFLILLWNLTPEPRYEIHLALQEIYHAYAPSLMRYEGAETQAKILKSFGQNILDSGYFRDLVCEQMACEVSYTIDEYLNLLSTLRKLDPQKKELLFTGLREKLPTFGDTVQLSFLSGVHVAIKEG